MPRQAVPNLVAFPERPQQTAFISRGRHAENHISIPALAKLWDVSDDFLRDMFRDEPGVLRITRPASERKRKSGTAKREYVTWKIPESVARRVYERLTSS